MKRHVKTQLETFGISLLAAFLTDVAFYLSDPETAKTLTIPLIGMVILRNLVRLTADLLKHDL